MKEKIKVKKSKEDFCCDNKGRVYSEKRDVVCYIISPTQLIWLIQGKTLEIKREKGAIRLKIEEETP